MSQINEIYKLYKECDQKISINSRSNDIKNSLFFGIKGEKFDGNLFVEKALENGAKYAIKESNKNSDNPKIIHVKDTIKTLQLLAKKHRENFNIPIISITGSNGKTTTKDILNNFLSTRYNTCCTQGNYNNHIGVPLTLLSLDNTHDIGIIEMGANSLGEIKLLCQIAQPTSGIITSIGKAHLEGFGNLENIIKAKSELYEFIMKKNGTLFVDQQNKILLKLTSNYENKYFYNAVLESRNKKQTNASLYFECNPFISIQWKKNKIKTNIIGNYNATNIAAAIKIANYFNINDEEICYVLRKLELQNNRSEFIKTDKNEIILDAYNANPTSTTKAIKNFIIIKDDYPLLKHTVIIGDMLELGEYSIKYHQEIVDLLNNLKIKNCYLIGPIFQKTNYPKYFNHCISVEACEKLIVKNKILNSLILIKGSRKLKLEKLKSLL